MPKQLPSLVPVHVPTVPAAVISLKSTSERVAKVPFKVMVLAVPNVFEKIHILRTAVLAVPSVKVPLIVWSPARLIL